MEYYWDYFSFIKYYFLVLYYQLAEYAPIVRITAVFILVCFSIFVILLLSNMSKTQRIVRFNRKKNAFSDKYYNKLRDIALSPDYYSPTDVANEMGLPKNFRIKRKKWAYIVRIFRKLIVDVKDSGMNPENWKSIMLAFKMPNYFDKMVRSQSMKERLSALKDVSDISCDLKEATAARYLYAKDGQLRITARLHGARYGVDHPFAVFREDAASTFTDEMCVKLHWVLTYRKAAGMSLPNFIRWCSIPDASLGFKLFAISEIRLFEDYADCAELLVLLKNTRDERIACEIIRTLGELKYVEAEPEFFRRYAYAGVNERLSLAEALGIIASGNPEVIRFLIDDYKTSTDTVVKVRLLRVLYEYGDAGRQAFLDLKAGAPKTDARIFEHVECELIDSRRYA